LLLDEATRPENTPAATITTTIIIGINLVKFPFLGTALKSTFGEGSISFIFRFLSLTDKMTKFQAYEAKLSSCFISAGRFALL